LLRLYSSWLFAQHGRGFSLNWKPQFQTQKQRLEVAADRQLSEPAFETPEIQKALRTFLSTKTLTNLASSLRSALLKLPFLPFPYMVNKNTGTLSL